MGIRASPTSPCSAAAPCRRRQPARHGRREGCCRRAQWAFPGLHLWPCTARQLSRYGQLLYIVRHSWHAGTLCQERQTSVSHSDLHCALAEYAVPNLHQLCPILPTGKRDTLAGLRPGSSKASMARGSLMPHLQEAAGARCSHSSGCPCGGVDVSHAAAALGTPPCFCCPC